MAHNNTINPNHIPKTTTTPQSLQSNLHLNPPNTPNTITFLDSELSTLPYPYTIISQQLTKNHNLTTTIQINTPHQIITTKLSHQNYLKPLYKILSKPNKNTPFYHFTNSFHNKSKSFQLSYHQL